MTAVAIITARGGSKRIPRKNSRSFLGKPIMAYPIEAARQSGLFDTVMVSTDDDALAELALSLGATVPFRRRPQTADDFATTAQVLQEVLTDFADRGQVFDRACCLYPTAPFITPDLLQRAFSMLADHDFDTVYPVQPFSFPVQRAITLNGSRVAWLAPEHALTRSQDLTPAYHDAGQFYAFNTSRFRQSGQLITANSGGLVIPELHAHDIDTEADWQIAEFKYRLMQNEGIGL
ncbi:pseudaminic acid cytidylyltransferase [Spirosoma luteolum]